MEQIFNRVEHAKENSQIWIFVKSPFITNKPHAVGVAAMAQTKVIEIFNLKDLIKNLKAPQNFQVKSHTVFQDIFKLSNIFKRNRKFYCL